uniref:Cytochrome P450 n=1 Tax=Parastrongyloides trichosuri TaxID=131310 RepID=A0A0N4Z405_PARTI
MILLPIVFTLLTIFTVLNFYKLRTWWIERKRKHYLAEKIPGPKGLPILGNMLDAVGDPKRFISFLDKEDKIGFKNKDPFRRFWIGDTLLVHALSTEARKVIIDSSVEINKGTNYDFLIDWLGKGLLTSDGSKWKHRRRILTPTFHFNMLKKYFDVFNNEAKVLTEKFRKYAEVGEEVDVFDYIKRMALDIICETAMGVKIHAQDNPDQPYINAVKTFVELSVKYFRNMFFKITPIYYIFGEGFKRDKTLKVLKKFTSDIIRQKAEEFELNNGELKDNTFLSNLLQLKNENKWTDEDLREEVETFMFAGHDTTSSLMTFLLWALAQHQDIQERVIEEIYDVFGEEERNVTVEDLPKLIYSEMVIKEALRRYATVPYYNRCLTREIEVCGYLLPKGALFVFPLQHTNFNPEIFPDPYKFDPDRFLPENASKRSVYDFTPFSAGPRNCIGQKFAMHEIKTTLVWILRRFKLKSNKSEDFVKCIPQVIQTPLTKVPIIFEIRKN